MTVVEWNSRDEPDVDHEPIVPVRRCPLLGLLVPVLVGIVVDRYASIGFRQWLILAAASWAAWWCVERWLDCSDRLPGWRYWLTQSVPTLLLFLSVSAVAGAWHHARWNLYPTDEIGLSVTEIATPACVQVEALEFPRLIKRWEQDPLQMLQVEDQTVCRVRMLAVRDGDEWVTKSGRLDMRITGQLLGVKPGDVLQAFGKLQRPGDAMNPGGFSYDEFERSERRLAMLRVNYPHAVTVIENGNRWSPRWSAAYVRDWARDTLRHYLSPETFPLAVAIILGDRDQLSRDRAEVFLHTGTVHLLAISGLHLAILAGAVLYLLLRMGMLPTRVALWSVMLLTLGYVVISGGRAPVVRAAILIFVYCFGKLKHRDGLGMNSLAGAAMIVLALNPCQLFRSGAQLSFLAVAGMVWLLPYLTWRPPPTPIERIIKHYRTYPQVIMHVIRNWFVRMVLATFVIWFVSLPLVMNRFHLVSPSGLLLNLFVWIPLAFSLFFGFCVLLLGWLCPPAAHLCANVCDRALTLMEAVPNWAEPISGSHFWVPGPSDFAVILFYSFLIFGLNVFRGRRSWMIGPVGAFAVLAVTCFSGIERRAPENQAARPMQCAFLSVGHGACAVLEFPDGQLWVVDAGSLSSSRTSVGKISNYLWERGITRIDALVLSHADIDHYNASPGLITRFDIGRVLVSPAMFTDDSRSLERLRHCFSVAEVPVVELAAGDDVEELGGAQLEVLHPARDWLAEGDNRRTDNSKSIVMTIEVYGQRLLLAGDVEDEGLDWLIENVETDADVALAPHHGSKGSRPAEFCQWCDPEYVVVSAGMKSVGTTGPRAYEKAGARVMHTAASGAVEFLIGPTGMAATEFRGGGTYAGK